MVIMLVHHKLLSIFLLKFSFSPITCHLWGQKLKHKFEMKYFFTMDIIMLFFFAKLIMKKLKHKCEIIFITMDIMILFSLRPNHLVHVDINLEKEVERNK